MGLRNTLSSGLPVSSLARCSPVTALRSPWRPLGDQAPLRAKGVLRSSFQSLAYRKEPGVGEWGRGHKSWMWESLGAPVWDYYLRGLWREHPSSIVTNFENLRPVL